MPLFYLMLVIYINVPVCTLCERGQNIDKKYDQCMRMEGAIHLEVSERIGLRKFYKTGTLEISYNFVIKF